MARPRLCGRCNKPKRPKGKKYINIHGYCECGRKKIVDNNVIQKLRDSFRIGLSDEKACAYANISTATLYNYQKENPEFLEEKNSLKLSPDIKAQQTVVGALGDPNQAWRWLEKRDKDFMPTTKIEHAGLVEVLTKEEEMSDEEIEAVKLLRIARRKRIEEKTKKMK